MQLPDALKEDALHLRNSLLDYRMRNLGAVIVDASRAVEGIAPRLNQMALPLLSLMDDATDREEFTALLREASAALDAERESDPESRILAALERLESKGAPSIPLHAIAREASADGQGGALYAREAGRYLRDGGIVLHKSHGSIVVQNRQYIDKVA
ncbi:MAG: hypothetical protein JO261_07665 [Alphaproteobacteria bacterium]|nr:hypothetical protein [Alphaproteobacteria bacterium]